MSNTTNSLQVYENSNKALLTLTALWETMLKIIRSVSTASGSSLTVEPDLLVLQKTRKEFEILLKSLQLISAWLEQNPLSKNDQPNSKEWTELTKENELVVKEADSVNEQLKQMLENHMRYSYKWECSMSRHKKAV
ncbi:unnamed protein product [Rhizopus stolonifer]